MVVIASNVALLHRFKCKREGGEKGKSVDLGSSIVMSNWKSP